MTRNQTHLPLLIGAAAACALAVLLAGPALAQASEASGQVLDTDGNPVVGAELTFIPRGNTALEYTGKTNKKGRYFVPGLFTPVEGDRWDVTIEAEGYLPVEVTIENRTVNRILIGDIETLALKPKQQVPPLNIRPLGHCKVDFKLASEAEVMAQARAEAQAAAQAAAAEAGTGKEGAPAVPQKDPYDEALSLANAGDLESSVPFFEKALKREPDDLGRREAYAGVLYRLHRYDEARAAAQQAIELDPQTVDARMVLYSVAVAEQDLPAAKATLLEAREVAPDNVRVLEQLAWVASESGETDEAIAAYESLTELDPENSNAWLSLGDLYAASGQLEKSEAAFQRMTEIDPEGAHRVFFNLGALMMNKQDRSEADTQKAITAFRKATEIKPDYAQAYRELALALLQVGDTKGAADNLAEYVALAPEAPDAASMQALIKSLSQ
jgi:tetratricopeptide (TPR) repeat protein